MKITVKIVLLLSWFGLANAWSQDSIEKCQGAITYDTVAIDQNFASKLAVWESIDRTTFDEQRTNAGGNAVINGIPAGLSYDQFDQERTRLRESFRLQQNVTISSNSKWQAVDPGSTRRYIECIDAASTKKFTAAVVFATREVVSIHLKKVENSGQMNRDVVKVVLVSGGQASRKTVTLAGNAATSLSFKRNKKEPFAVSLVLFSPNGDDIDAVDIALPKFSNIRNEPIQGTKSSNHALCIQTYIADAQSPMRIVADLDEVLVVGTHEPHYTFINGAGPGAVSHTLSGSTTRSMEMLGKCASSDNNTSAAFDMWFNAKTLKDNFVDADLDLAADELEKPTKIVPHKRSSKKTSVSRADASAKQNEILKASGALQNK